jgi:hypothetical protein
MSLVILSSLSLFIFGILFIPDTAHTDIPADYCYDQDMEGYVCFETFRICEKEQNNDLLAESKCYED